MALSPLAQENLTKLQALAASIKEGQEALSADLSDPENQTDDALAGPEFFGLCAALLKACRIWHRTAEQIIIAQPEYQAWLAEQEAAEKPGLND